MDLDFIVDPHKRCLLYDGRCLIMMLDNGVADQVKIALIIASCGLFWVTPALVISSVAAGFFFRKNGKLMLSVAIQLAPTASALLAFLLLAVSF